MIKRKLKLGGAVVSGAALGFITLNVPGAILGGYTGYQVADKILDEKGNNTKKLF